MGAVIALLATYPLKTISTLQAISSTGSSPPAQGQAAATSLGVLGIIKKYRLSGLYSGIQPNIVETAVSSFVYFYVSSSHLLAC